MKWHGVTWMLSRNLDTHQKKFNFISWYISTYMSLMDGIKINEELQ